MKKYLSSRQNVKTVSALENNQFERKWQNMLMYLW